MEPNFHNNEYILTDKISYRFAEPIRGDVVIFKAPTNPDVDYIKRIICLSGERVKIQNGSVYINGRILNEPYVTDPTTLTSGSYMKEGIEIVVPQDEYFVLGDNRPHSSDSREFGPIPTKLIIGKALLRYWPLPEVGLLPKVGY
jgi:signal peptidase I